MKVRPSQLEQYRVGQIRAAPMESHQLALSPSLGCFVDNDLEDVIARAVGVVGKRRGGLWGLAPEVAQLGGLQTLTLFSNSFLIPLQCPQSYLPQHLTFECYFQPYCEDMRYERSSVATITDR